MSIPIAGPGNGLVLATVSYRMVSTNAVSYGDAVAVDTASVNATTGFFDTVDNSANASSGADPEWAIVGLCMESGGIAAGGAGLFMFRGMFSRAVTSDTVATGDPMQFDAASDDLTSTISTGDKIIAFALTANSGTEVDVMFDGIAGFGSRQG